MSGLHILLIDDDPIEHRIFRKLLESGQNSQTKLSCCSDINTAIAFLKENSFDYIFLDDRLSPFTSLLETLPQIREYLQEAKTIAISSSLDSPHLTSAKEIGVDEIIDKNDLKAFLTAPLPWT
jgi:CheY-like chemotaxis protein